MESPPTTRTVLPYCLLTLKDQDLSQVYYRITPWFMPTPSPPNPNMELSSLRSLTSRLGNSTISERGIRGFGGKDVLSPKG
jgi:hypothetical protein